MIQRCVGGNRSDGGWQQGGIVSGIWSGTMTKATAIAAAITGYSLAKSRRRGVASYGHA